MITARTIANTEALRQGQRSGQRQAAGGGYWGPREWLVSRSFPQEDLRGDVWSRKLGLQRKEGRLWGKSDLEKGRVCWEEAVQASGRLSGGKAYRKKGKRCLNVLTSVPSSCSGTRVGSAS